MKIACWVTVLLWLYPMVGARAEEREFPIMNWDLPSWSAKLMGEEHHGVASLAECGYTVAGFVRPEHLKACERLGLKGIVAREKWLVEWRKLSDAQIEKTVRDLIEESGNS